MAIISSGGQLMKKVVACVVLMWMVVGTLPSGAEGAITCGTVVKSLLPCRPYLTKGGMVPPPCCAGVRSLAKSASTTADRRTACGCLKSASGGVNLSLAAGLPSKCGVSIPYKISPSTDCTKVQ